MPEASNQAAAYQNELMAWFYTVPLVTRFLFTATCILSLLANFKLIPFSLLALTPQVYSGLQLWRLITPYFIVGLGMNLMFHLYFLYTYSRGLEEGYFAGRHADYVWFLVCAAAVTNTVGIVFEFPYLTGALLGALIYLWSQVNRDQTVNFMFGLRFKGMYLPLVLIAYDVLMNNFNILMIVGMAAAHVYWYMETSLPDQLGWRPLATPSFLLTFMPYSEGAMGGFTSGGGTSYQAKPASASSSTAGTTFKSWGKGNKLG